MVSLKDLKQCPECGSDKVVYKKNDDELVCRECGAITSELTPELEAQLERASEVLKSAKKK